MRLSFWTTLALCTLPMFSQVQPHSGPHRMEITLERFDSNKWKVVDPRSILAQNDHVRFRFRSNFDGYLYVMNQATSGKYEQLFPHADTGNNNQIVAGRDYTIPASDRAFRMAGPPGHEIVYWLVNPVALLENGVPEHVPLPPPPSPDKRLPFNLTPRCDDETFRARGDCIDNTAGPRGTSTPLPQNLVGVGALTPRDLLFMRKQNTAVVASRVPLTGPIIYEFRLAHR